MQDILIVGAGPAGLTAAIYARRYGYGVTVFEQLQHGGQIATTPEVENYPAFERITGFDLAQKLHEQALALGVTMVQGRAVSLDLADGRRSVLTESECYEGRAIILASGAKRRKLGCTGEDAFFGRGVSYCATCDGNFFRGRAVAIVGGGNTALEDALFLAKLCQKVTLIHRKDSFRGLPALAEAVRTNPKIEVLYRAKVTEIAGGDAVARIELEVDGAPQTIAVSGIFVAIGTEPDHAFLENQLALDPAGYLIAGEDCKTKLPLVFAAGDCRTKALRQIVTATADGAVAAFMAANALGADM